MASGKSIDKICVVVTVLALVLTLLFMNGEALGIEKIADPDAESAGGDARFTANDLNADWDRTGATEIALTGGVGTVNGSGAYFYDGSLVIASAGKYVLTGTLDDGYISVDTSSGAKVWILLDGVDVNCSDNAALRIEQADKVFLTLAEGTENSLSSGGTYSEAALADKTGGTIYAHDDLTINGGGSLAVTAEYKHGIDANDSLTITGGTISITCPQDGLHVNDDFGMTGASLAIAAGDDGVHSDTSFYIESGTLLISECNEGIEAPVIEIEGGDITIYPTDDGLNAGGGGSGNVFGGMGGPMGGFGSMGGGRPDMQRQQDGTFDPAQFTPDQNGGGMPQRMAQNAEASETGANSESDDESEVYLRISGGNLTIINENARDADGIDSNGSIYITGGVIRVSMGGNGFAFDAGTESGGVMEISGGTVVGCGSYTMAESFDNSSAQPSILYTYSAGAEAGTTVLLEDAAGNELLRYVSPCSFACLNLSCPELRVGETYRVVIGDSEEEITLTDVSASYGDAQSGGFGGRMNFGGGMQPRGGGGGMRGGGGWNRGAENSSAETGEMPVPPEFDGEMPEWTNFGGERPERPDFSGEIPDMSGGFRGGAGTAAAEETTAETELSPEVWLWLGVSAAVLLAGLAIGKLYAVRGRRG